MVSPVPKIAVQGTAQQTNWKMLAASMQQATALSGQHVPPQGTAQSQFPTASHVWPPAQDVPAGAGPQKPELHVWHVPQEDPLGASEHAPVARSQVLHVAHRGS
jgi:hypothetical protein